MPPQALAPASTEGASLTPHPSSRQPASRRASRICCSALGAPRPGEDADRLGHTGFKSTMAPLEPQSPLEAEIKEKQILTYQREQSDVTEKFHKKDREP